MATVKAIVLKNFATIGIPDFESGEESLNKTWSVVGISENLIDEVFEKIKKYHVKSRV